MMMSDFMVSCTVATSSVAFFILGIRRPPANRAIITEVSRRGKERDDLRAKDAASDWWNM